jgi:hypothetical protein
MKNKHRYISILRTYALSEEKNIAIILDEIQFIIDEDLEYDPMRYSFLVQCTLTSCCLSWSNKLVLLKKLFSMGITDNCRYVFIESLEYAIWTHNYAIIEELVKLGISIHESNFRCLMTDDRHITFLYRVKELLPFGSSSLRNYMNIAISCRAWRILDFLLTISNHVTLTKRRRNIYGVHKHDSIIFELVTKSSEDIFIKYLLQFYDKGLKNEEESIPTLNKLIKKGYDRAFRIIFKRLEFPLSSNYNNIIRSIMNNIIQHKSAKFLAGIDNDKRILGYMLKRVIDAGWFVGAKTLLENSIMMREDLQYDHTVKSWFVCSYRPRKREHMTIHEYLKKCFPSFYVNWKAEMSAVAEEH